MHHQIKACLGQVRLYKHYIKNFQKSRWSQTPDSILICGGCWSLEPVPDPCIRCTKKWRQHITDHFLQRSLFSQTVHIENSWRLASLMPFTHPGLVVEMTVIRGKVLKCIDQLATSTYLNRHTNTVKNIR